MLSKIKVHVTQRKHNKLIQLGMVIIACLTLSLKLTQTKKKKGGILRYCSPKKGTISALMFELVNAFPQIYNSSL